VVVIFAGLVERLLGGEPESCLEGSAGVLVRAGFAGTLVSGFVQSGDEKITKNSLVAVFWKSSGYFLKFLVFPVIFQKFQVFPVIFRIF
jgi:hypothetical protein